MSCVLVLVPEWASGRALFELLDDDAPRLAGTGGDEPQAWRCEWLNVSTTTVSIGAGELCTHVVCVDVEDLP